MDEQSSFMCNYDEFHIAHPVFVTPIHLVVANRVIDFQTPVCCSIFKQLSQNSCVTCHVLHMSQTLCAAHKLVRSTEGSQTLCATCE